MGAEMQYIVSSETIVNLKVVTQGCYGHFKAYLEPYKLANLLLMFSPSFQNFTP